MGWRPCCSVGQASAVEFQIEPKAFSRSAYWGFYFQDDWKITNKLTLNLGLRYDFDVPRWEAQNRYSYWDLDAQSPVQVPGFDTRGVIKFVDDNNRSPFKSDRTIGSLASVSPTQQPRRQRFAPVMVCSIRFPALRYSGVQVLGSPSTPRQSGRSTPTPH